MDREEKFPPVKPWVYDPEDPEEDDSGITKEETLKYEIKISPAMRKRLEKDLISIKTLLKECLSNTPLSSFLDDPEGMDKISDSDHSLLFMYLFEKFFVNSSFKEFLSGPSKEYIEGAKAAFMRSMKSSEDPPE